MLKIHFPWEKLHSSVGFSPALPARKRATRTELAAGVGLCQTSKPISEAEKGRNNLDIGGNNILDVPNYPKAVLVESRLVFQKIK